MYVSLYVGSAIYGLTTSAKCTKQVWMKNMSVPRLRVLLYLIKSLKQNVLHIAFTRNVVSFLITTLSKSVIWIKRYVTYSNQAVFLRSRSKRANQIRLASVGCLMIRRFRIDVWHHVNIQVCLEKNYRNYHPMTFWYAHAANFYNINKCHHKFTFGPHKQIGHE